ncbi:MAG TPA: lipase secretion chaperone [Terriglobales bacterium]|nr:lipase secretion chaperone [Terriglobales bacterium]
MRSPITALTVGAAAGLALWTFSSPPEAPQPVPVVSSGVQAASASLGEPGSGLRLGEAASSLPELPPPPRSLDDTAVDGELTLDANGGLLPSPEVRKFFDYFLSAAGEETAQHTYTRIVGAIRARLRGAAATEAVALLDRYIEYRRRLRQLYQRDGAATTDLVARLAEVRAIRRAVLGEAAAAAMFGEEERVQEIALQRRALIADATLSEAQKEQRLNQLEADLPEPVRAAAAESLAPLRLQRDEAELRAAGGDENEIRSLRESYFGAEAAERLARLDGEEARWQERVAAYQQARRALLARSDFDDAARQRALDQLLRERFSATERLRIE